MFGFKSKKFTRDEEKPAPPPADGKVFTTDTPIPAPVELPLDGVVPDPPDEPEPETENAKPPMLDFASPPQSEEATGDSSSSLADLFSGTEDESQSDMGAILEKAPQATLDELMEDLSEIKEMLRGRLGK